MIEGFEEFEELLSRCLSSEKNARPLNAIVLRDEPVFEGYLHRIEAGERPSDMFVPPEEIIRRLREENKKKSDEIKQLQERIKFLEQENSEKNHFDDRTCDRVYTKEKSIVLSEIPSSKTDESVPADFQPSRLPQEVENSINSLHKNRESALVRVSFLKKLPHFNSDRCENLLEKDISLKMTDNLQTEVLAMQ